MGQFATHMNITNGTKCQVTVTAHVHSVEKNTSSAHSVVINGGGLSLITLSRHHPGRHTVDWTIQLSNGTHACFRTELAASNQNATMYVADGQVLIDGKAVGRVVAGNPKVPPPARQASTDSDALWRNRREVPPTMLPKGRVIQLRNFHTGKFLNVLEDKSQNCNGERNGKFTRFVVDPSKEGFLRLRSEALPDKYLAVKSNNLCGNGGPRTEIKVFQIGPDRYILRAKDDSIGLAANEDSRGVRCNEKVKVGNYASFSLSFADVSPYQPPAHHPPPHAHHHVPPQAQHHAPPPAHHHVPPPAHHVPPPAHHHVPPQAQHHAPPPAHHVPPPAHHHVPPQAQHHAPPPAHHVPPPAKHVPPPAHHAPPPAKQMSTPAPILAAGNRVVLVCSATGKSARIQANGQLDGNGGRGQRAQFIVSPSTNGYLRFQLASDPKQYLSHKGTVGQGGPACEFVAIPTGKPDQFHFRSIDDKKALGFNPDGSLTAPGQVGRDARGSFSVCKA